MKKLSYVFNRLKEPSTWAGIAAIGAVVGVPTNTLTLAGQVIAGIAGILAVVVPEKVS